MADNFGLKIGIEGEKEFKKALSEINQSFKVLGSEMKLVSSQFDKNDKSVQALSARNTVLNKEIEAQKNKVETLRAALRNAADSFGENDRRTQNWQIQLNNAEAALNSMERELSDNERAIEALSREETDAADATERLSQEIARQEDALAGMKRAYSNAVLQYGKGSGEAKELEGRISRLSGELRENRERMKDAGDVAEDLGDSLEDASEGADKLGSGLSVATVAMGNLIASGIQAALNGIKELGSAIWNLDEATEEYRVAQGKLTTAFEAAGYSGETAQKSYNEFYKILGDTDTATEASQLLAQLAQNEQDITKWTNIAAGVYGTFGDALPIEGMIESANETAKVGQVTGSLADALNWVGISEDEFNEKLAACSDESERNRLIMETLSGAYDEASGAFYRNNEALVASREGQAQLDETLAGLGETISNVKNSLRAEFLPAISEVISAFTDMINGVDGADEAFAGAITGLVNTAVSMLPQFVDTGMQILTSLLSGIIQSLPAVVEGAAQIIVTLAQGIAEAVPTLIPQIVLVVTQIVQTLIENLPMILDAALQLILGTGTGAFRRYPCSDCGFARHHHGACGIYRRGDPPDHRRRDTASDLPDFRTAGDHHGHCGGNPTDHRRAGDGDPWQYPADHRSRSKPADFPDSEPAHHHYHHCRGDPTDHYKHHQCPCREHRQDHPGRRTAFCGPDHQPSENHCGNRKGGAADHLRHREGLCKRCVPDGKHWPESHQGHLERHRKCGKLAVEQGQRLLLEPAQ